MRFGRVPIYSCVWVAVFLGVALDTRVSRGETQGFRAVDTGYDSTRATYSTQGTVGLPVTLELATRIILNFSEYGNWALKGINGDEENSQGFIALLREMRFLPSDIHEGSGRFEVVYDVDLIWPFGSKGNKIELSVSDLRRDDQQRVKALRLAMAKPNLVLSSFWVQFEVISQTQEKVEVQFRCETTFVGWLNTFFDLNRYKKNIEWRLLKLMENLVERSQKRSSLAL